MAASQYSIFTSSDVSGPGKIAGTNGDLIRVLTACLVTGYSGVTAVSWTNPIATASNIASYRPPSGSRLILVVGDDGTAAIGLGAKAAYFAGWETLAGIATPVGSGGGQFPTTAQFATVGAVVAVKSTTSDATLRSWILFADAYGFQFFVDSDSSGTAWMGCGFGDIFSAKLTTDTYRCMVNGNSFTAVNAANSMSDKIGIPYNAGSTNAYNSAGVTAHYVARTMGGGGGSVQVTPVGDASVVAATATNVSNRAGVIPFNPNTPQFIFPIRVFEFNGTYRGRMRGVYHTAHPTNNYTNGTTFSGSGDYAGKTFQVVGTAVNGGLWIMETSNTLDNN